MPHYDPMTHGLSKAAIETTIHTPDFTAEAAAAAMSRQAESLHVVIHNLEKAISLVREGNYRQAHKAASAAYSDSSATNLTLRHIALTLRDLYSSREVFQAIARGADPNDQSNDQSNDESE